MKKIIALLVFYALTAAVFAQTNIPLDQALDNCAAYLKTQLPRGVRVAVIKIEARTEAFSDQVTEDFSSKLVALNYLTVVERGRTLKALETEQNYQMSGNVSDETASSIGKQLGAEFIIAGSIMPRGDHYSMNVRVVHVETARIQTQWSANNVRIDPSLVQIDTPTMNAIVRFAGTALGINDQDALIQDLQRALVSSNVLMEVFSADEAPVNTPYNFLITLRINPRTQAQAADLTIALRQGNRVLKQSDRHTFSELNTEYLIRKSGEVIINDRAFFQSLPGILANH